MSNKWLKTALFTALMMTAFGLQGLCAAEGARAQFTTGVVDREPGRAPGSDLRNPLAMQIVHSEIRH